MSCVPGSEFLLSDDPNCPGLSPTGAGGMSALAFFSAGPAGPPRSPDPLAYAPLLTQTQLQVGNPFPEPPDIFIGFVAPAPPPPVTVPELPPLAVPILGPLFELLPALGVESDTGLIAQMQELAQRLGLLPTTPAEEEFQLTAPLFIPPPLPEPEFAAIAPPVVPPPPPPTAFEDELPPNWQDLMGSGDVSLLEGGRPLAIPRWLSFVPGAITRFLTPGVLSEPDVAPAGPADPFAAPELQPIPLPGPGRLPGVVQPAPLGNPEPAGTPDVGPYAAPNPLVTPQLAPTAVPLPSLGTGVGTSGAPAVAPGQLTFAAPQTGAPSVTPLRSPALALAPSLGTAPAFAESPFTQPFPQTANSVTQKQCAPNKPDKKKKQKKKTRTVCHTGTYIEHSKGLSKHPRRVIQCR